MATSEDSTISGERSPLLLAASESTVQEDGDVPRGASGATFLQNVLNCAKTCMGTGALALPYSARQGGVVLHFLGVLALAGWNLYSVNLLLNCLELLPRPTQRREKPPNGVSTLGKVAFYALGHSGLHVLDLSFAIWLFGVLVAYMTAIVAFLMPTPLTTGSGDLDALIIAVIIGFFSNVPDVSIASRLLGRICNRERMLTLCIFLRESDIFRCRWVISQSYPQWACQYCSSHLLLSAVTANFPDFH